MARLAAHMETPTNDARLSEALLALLAHDLRAPLGPLALATQSIADDLSASVEVRDLARFAEAQSARISRLIDAARAATGLDGPHHTEECDVPPVVHEAARFFRTLGGSCSVSVQPCAVNADPRTLRDAIAGLLDCAGGEGGSADVEARRIGEFVRFTVRGSDVGRCSDAFAATLPGDWRAAFVLGAQSVLRSYGGGIELADGSITAWLPARES